MALGLGYGLPFAVKRPVSQYLEDMADAAERAAADGATREAANNCLDARGLTIMQRVQTQPSILVVPQLYKAGVLYDQLPSTRTNYLPNNTMVGATGSVLPSGWSIGSLPAGITVAYSASGTVVAADGVTVNYIDFTFSGTAAASGFLNLRPNAAVSLISAVSGQTWTTSVYLSLTSGSVSTISPTWQLQEQTSGDVFLAGSNIGGLSSITSTLQRYQVTRLLTESTTAKLQVRWGHSIVSGTAYNYTIRIASPQLEELGRATAIIPTSSGTVTVLNNTTNVSGLPPDFTVTRATTATRVNSSGLIESVASGVPRIDWLGQSCPALLVEPSATNLVLQSRDLSVSGSWTASGITAVRNATGADGTASGACTLTSTAADATIVQNLSHASQSRIFSASIRRVSGSGGIELTTNGGTNWTAVTITTAFTRVACAAQTVASGQVGIRMKQSDNVIEVDFTQGEVGPVATSPIPTTTGSASRNADNISASGSLVSGLIGQTEGTIYLDLSTIVGTNSAVIFGLTDSGANNNRIRILGNSSRELRFIFQLNGNITQYDFTRTGAVTSLTDFKIAIAYKSGDIAVAVNGSIINTSANTLTFNGPLNSVELVAANIGFLTQQYRAAALYTTRLTDDELAQLTT